MNYSYEVLHFLIFLTSVHITFALDFICNNNHNFIKTDRI